MVAWSSYLILSYILEGQLFSHGGVRKVAPEIIMVKARKFEVLSQQYEDCFYLN